MLLLEDLKKTTFEKKKLLNYLRYSSVQRGYEIKY